MKTGFFRVSGILMGILIWASCERDDVCSEGSTSTPKLLMAFYNKDDKTVKKSVTSLRVIGVGMKEAYPDADRESRDSISVPIKVFDVETDYVLISNSRDAQLSEPDPTDEDSDEESKLPEDLGNKDTISITYRVKEQFYYRGCGFVAQFENLDVQLKTDNDNWIDSAEVLTSEVIEEKQAHVKIYH